MTQPVTDLAAPVSERERIGEIDVLRGVALFGVLAMNFVYFAGEGQLATKAQLDALPTAGADWWSYNAVRLFIGDKANTVFATLFGLGFYLQMQRGEGRPGFERRYVRRLTWLLVFGVLNTLFLWFGDILNLYAVAGFALLAMRRWRTRTLVVFGLVAALYSHNLQELLLGLAGIHPIPDSLYADAAVLERQAVATSGDYGAIVALFAEWTWIEWLAGGMMAAWLVYAIGRFALGAAIGRSGILDDIPRFIPLLRRIAWIAFRPGWRSASSSGWCSRASSSCPAIPTCGPASSRRCARPPPCCSPPVIARQSSWRCRPTGVVACSARSVRSGEWRSPTT